MIIAETGACFSGKTTFAESLKKLYPEVIRQDEIKLDKVYEDDEIRTKRGLSIDQIRQDPYLYFRWEKAIISKKIDQELTAALKYPRDSIIIFERSLADSFYYLTRFVDISNFNDAQLKDYNDFVQYVLDAAKDHYTNVYDHILIFQPVIFENLDCERRPKSLKKDHMREYQSIRMLNIGMTPSFFQSKIKEVNMASVELTQVDTYVSQVFKSIEDIHKNLQKR